MSKIKIVIQSLVVTCLAIVCVFICRNNETVLGNNISDQTVVPVHYDYNETYGFTNDLTYKSYGNAFIMESGSTWTIRDLKIDVADGSSVWICMFNKMNGEETLIAEYAGQACMEYTVTEDGAYEIYARAGMGDKERIIDLKDMVDVSYTHISESSAIKRDNEADSHILQLN